MCFNYNVSFQIINNKGDTNLDGLVNDIDYDLMIEYLMSSAVFDLSERWAGDIDFDTRLSIFDLIYLNNMIDNGSDRSH